KSGISPMLDFASRIMARQCCSWATPSSHAYTSNSGCPGLELGKLRFSLMTRQAGHACLMRMRPRAPSFSTATHDLWVELHRWTANGSESLLASNHPYHPLVQNGQQPEPVHGATAPGPRSIV